MKPLSELARERLDGFKIECHGEVGEPSNGALLRRLADYYDRPWWKKIRRNG